MQDGNIDHAPDVLRFAAQREWLHAAGGKVRDAGQRARAYGGKVRAYGSKIRGYGGVLTEQIKAHPFAAAGIAFAAGYLAMRVVRE